MLEDFANAVPSAAPQAHMVTPPVNAITNCRLPPFWRTNPELWFIQVESAFQIHQISSDNTKYHMVVAVMDSETVTEVADVLRAPPVSDKYAALKQATLQRMTDSADLQLHKLLTGIELGDKKPSQLLREMRSLANSRTGDDVLRVRLLDPLPPNTQRILRVFKDSKTLGELADAADEVNECGSYIMATGKSGTHRSSMPETADLRQAIAHLGIRTRQNSERTQKQSDFARRRQSATRALPPQGRRALTQIANAATYCWYQSKFGDRAECCRQPCNYPTARQAPRSTQENF